MHKNYNNSLKIISSYNRHIHQISSKRYVNLKSLIHFNSFDDNFSNIKSFTDIPFRISNAKGYILMSGDRNYLVYDDIYQNSYYLIKDMFRRKMTFRRSYDSEEDIYYNELLTMNDSNYDNKLFDISENSYNMYRLGL